MRIHHLATALAVAAAVALGAAGIGHALIPATPVPSSHPVAVHTPRSTPADVVPAPVRPAPTQVQEDDPSWHCASNGNHICGPGNPEHAPAGCYTAGVLTVPWSNYANPKADPLYGVMPLTAGKRDYPPCTKS